MDRSLLSECTSFNMFLETVVPSEVLIVSNTDEHGTITYVNKTFATISGYNVDELIGKPHNIVRHPDMPISVFKKMWQSLRSDGFWAGYVKNLRKDRGYYWVYAEVTAEYEGARLWAITQFVILSIMRLKSRCKTATIKSA